MNQAFEVLHASDAGDFGRWSSLIASSDVYYSPVYAQANAEVENAEAIAVVAKGRGSQFLAPLLVRHFSLGNLEWKDAISPYGYGGLLSFDVAFPSTHALQILFQNLRDWCREQKIVCGVIRLHPLTGQLEWFAKENPYPEFLHVHVRGVTAAINLQQWDTERERPTGIGKGRKSDLNVARRSLRVEWSNESEENLRHFQSLYRQTMENRTADAFYQFPPSYFSRLASLGEHCNVALAWLNDEPVGGSIFLTSLDYAHYHLAASNEAGIKHRAGTLLIAEGAKFARERGCRLLHLGGGVRPGDALEDFKFSFGGSHYQYAYLLLIADPDRFEQIRSLPDAPWPYNMHHSSQMKENQ